MLIRRCLALFASCALSVLKRLVAFPPRLKTSKEKSMAHSITKDINPQCDSPLFNCIPPEVRNHIFKLALIAYEDPTRRYRWNAYYYRPGYTCAHEIDTNLLLTCRLVHAETASLPASINEHVSWYKRGPPELKKNTSSLWMTAQHRRSGGESLARSISSPSNSCWKTTPPWPKALLLSPGSGISHALPSCTSPSGTPIGGGGKLTLLLHWTRSKRVDPRLKSTVALLTPLIRSHGVHNSVVSLA